MAFSLKRAGNEILTDLINLANPDVDFAPTDLIFADPKFNSLPNSRNTCILVSFKDTTDKVGTQMLFYDRLVLSEKIKGDEATLENNAEYVTTKDLLDYVNDTFGLYLQEGDIYNDKIPAPDPEYPNRPVIVKLRAKHSSMVYQGGAVLKLTGEAAQTLADIVTTTDVGSITEPSGGLTEQ